MERGSDKHGPRVDDALAQEVEDLVRAGKETHAEEWKSAEPSGEDQPEVDLAPESTLHGGVPEGMSEEDVTGRTELARWLGRGVFPAVREVLIDRVMDAGAPDDVVAEVKRLPSGREFANVGDVWRTLHGGGHVEEHRF